MPIVCKTPIKQIQARIDRQVERVTEDVVYRLHMIGVAAVKRARELKPDEGSFHDITGNLRSSIGYTILVDGEERETGGFTVVSGSKGRGTQGAATGQSVISKLKSKYNKGIVLIVSAGMNYATYVESVRGKDVLTSAELEAERLAEKLLKRFK